MGIPRMIRRMSFRESEFHRNQLRKDQRLKEQRRMEQRRKRQCRRRRLEGIEGAIVILAIVAFFALIYWLAASDLLPAAY